MIAALARIAGFFGVPPVLIYAVVYGSIALVIGGSYLWVYEKGVAHANAAWKAKEYERVIYAQAQSIARYETAIAESARQREEEAKAASDRESVIAARVKELEDERVEREKSATDLEADLNAAITDKGKLDAIVSKLRATRYDCRASSRDLDVDQRMRRNKGTQRR
jgi:hypothetical protein